MGYFRRNFIVFFLVLGMTSSFVYGQIEFPEGKYAQESLKPLSLKEQIQLSSLPELKLSEEYRNVELPYAVDNSSQPYMREIFNQGGLDCGQASSVALAFTYEINRLRGLTSDQLSTTYPSYFPWNWENGGNGWYGVSFYHSMEVLRMVGVPNLEIYGETVNSGNSMRFMSGYDSYLNAMTNRIQGAYCIDVSDEEGLVNFKHWLYHHNEGSDIGGLAFFYSQCQTPNNYLPDGTEEEGKAVIIQWSSSPNHAMAIVGYNDSIKWDYNGDGQYTNNIDITGDGIVDVRDWEIGAVKMANTYHSYPNYTWGNDGYSYMMYRTLALDRYNGGIWNSTVNVLIAKEEYTPQLTMKVNMSHDKRSFVKMNVGMTTDMTSSEPMYILDFPIFDYQGDEHNMQGGTDAGDETIEFGFDLTPFLNYLEPGQNAKYFFQLDENDPDSTGVGQFNSMSLIDYTDDVSVETDCGQTNVSLVNNGLLRIPVSTAVNFSPPEITAENLPTAHIYEPYSYFLPAEGGTPPYRWSWDMDFEIVQNVITYPELVTQTIATGGYSWAEYELPFDFPYYDSVYSSVFVYNTGAIMMEQLSTDLPYNSDDDIVFFNRKMIAAMYSDENGSLGSPEMKVIEGSGYVHFVWEDTNYHYAIRLYESGQINIYYGENVFGEHPIYVAGVSSGNKEDFQLLGISNATSLENGLTFQMTPHSIPAEFDISEDGELTGLPSEQYLAEDFYFKVKDVNNLENNKGLVISTDGFIIDYTFHTLDNDSVENGENATIDITLINETGQTVTSVSTSLTCTHSGITIVDALESFGDITAGETVTIENAFSFDVGYGFENEDLVDFIIGVHSDQDDWQRPIVEPIYVPVITVVNAAIDDGDNARLDEGENVDYLLTVQNLGGADLSDVNYLLTTGDEYLSINISSDFSYHLEPDIQDVLNFNITADSETPQGHVAPMMLHIYNDNYEDSVQLFVSVGLIVEDWETGDLSTFSWMTEGEADWFIIDSIQNTGTYCLQSGDIEDSQSSSLKVGLTVLLQDSIRFHRKVSCELDVNNCNYDYLSFSIDDVEYARWDGVQDWEQFSYPVNAGFHIFEWNYIKDGSVDGNYDCAWIDDIILPSVYDAPPLFQVSVDSIYKHMQVETTDTDTILLTNIGGGIISYSLELRNVPSIISSDKSIEGSTVVPSIMGFMLGDSLNFDVSVTNGSDDSEWIKQIVFDFPAGVDITSAGDFYDTNDTLFSNGITGDGVIVTWFNETDSGWGIVSGGETATASISSDVVDDFVGDIEVEYQLVGDIYGADPHYVNGIFSIENLGPPIDWLQLNTEIGQVFQPNTDTIILNWDTHGLNAGIYEVNLNIYALNDTVVIPVTLEVEWPVNVETKTIEDAVVLFPNPVKDILNVNVYMSEDYQNVVVNVFDLRGVQVYSNVEEKCNKGFNRLNLDCVNFTPGTYFVEIQMNGKLVHRKFVKN